jgi:hypothetical protein
LGQKKSDHIRQLVAFLRSVDSDCQFRFELIHVLLLLEGKL